jgi:hypothetical protein
MSLAGLTTHDVPARDDVGATTLLAAFADQVAMRRLAAGGRPDPALGADTVRQLLAMVETLTRREVARRSGDSRR